MRIAFDFFRARATAILCCAAVGSGWVASPTRAAESPSKAPKSWLNPLRYRDLAFQQVRYVQHIEGVEMVSAIVGGSQMGPGEGWFHPSQSRYGWTWLAEQFDADKDGKITRKEFPGDDALFARLDRNHDGVLTAEDFDWSDSSPFLQKAGMARSWFSMVDSNGNGRISQEEWEAFFKKAAKGKNHVTLEDLQEAVTPPPAPKDGGGGPSVLILINGLFNGELGSFHEGPKVGERAPDFRLKTQDGMRELTLGQFKDKKPVVLVFGSFT
jgi:Ca2+-binding EF-hand superfamily protein